MNSDELQNATINGATSIANSVGSAFFKSISNGNNVAQALTAGLIAAKAAAVPVLTVLAIGACICIIDNIINNVSK